MKWLDNPKFVRVATIIVLGLIAIAAIAAAGLAYTVFLSPTATESEKIIAPTSARRGAQPTSTPVVLEYATPTRMSHNGLNSALGGSHPTPTATGTPIPKNPTATATPGAVESGIQSLPFAHPTYQPTTQPCSDCHNNLHPAN